MITPKSLKTRVIHHLTSVRPYQFSLVANLKNYVLIDNIFRGQNSKLEDNTFRKIDGKFQIIIIGV